MNRSKAIEMSGMKESTFKDYEKDMRKVFKNYGYDENGEIDFTVADVGAILFASGLRKNNKNLKRIDAVKKLQEFANTYGERKVSLKDLNAIMRNSENK